MIEPDAVLAVVHVSQAGVLTAFLTGGLVVAVDSVPHGRVAVGVVLVNVKGDHFGGSIGGVNQTADVGFAGSVVALVVGVAVLGVVRPGVDEFGGGIGALVRVEAIGVVGVSLVSLGNGFVGAVFVVEELEGSPRAAAITGGPAKGFGGAIKGVGVEIAGFDGGDGGEDFGRDTKAVSGFLKGFFGLGAELDRIIVDVGADIERAIGAQLVGDIGIGILAV